jgi:hypothetical protein
MRPFSASMFLPGISRPSTSNSHLCSYTSPAIMPQNSPASPRDISLRNPITGCIYMKTIIKRRMSFFPSCIIGSGLTFQANAPHAAARCQASQIFCDRTLAPPARQVSCRSPRPRSLTTEYIDISRRKQRDGVFAPARRQSSGRNSLFFQRLLLKKANLQNEPNPIIGQSPADGTQWLPCRTYTTELQPFTESDATSSRALNGGCQSHADPA